MKGISKSYCRTKTKSKLWVTKTKSNNQLKPIPANTNRFGDVETLSGIKSNKLWAQTQNNPTTQKISQLTTKKPQAKLFP
jgi:hypothetical protein